MPIERELMSVSPSQDETPACHARRASGTSCPISPLRAWAERFYGGLLARLTRLRVAVEIDRLEIEERVMAPVEQLANALDSQS